MGEKLTGAQILVKSLEAEKVSTIFGLPGGQVIPLYNALYDAKFNNILVRHEQAAAHAADGYSRASERAGVCIATSGPGATNLVTGIATAYMDSVPLVAITGQVPVTVLGTDAFQEADIIGGTMSFIKHSLQIHNPNDIPAVIKKAFYIASTGRPGPVLVDLPSNVQTAEGEFVWPRKLALPGYHPDELNNLDKLDEAVSSLEKAKRPVIYAGGGVLRSHASKQLSAIAKQLNAPVVTTLMGKGSLPESHPHVLGMAGMHGTPVSNRALQAADVILAIGTRLSDRTTGSAESFAPKAKIIHIDRDPAEVDKRIVTDIWLIGDAGKILGTLSKALTAKIPERKEWYTFLDKIKKKEPMPQQAFPGAVTPWQVLETLNEVTKGDITLTTEVGQHQMWAAQYFRVEEPNHFITSGGLGAMGFGFPAAMGAHFARPDRPVVCIAGDGSFMMNIQELDTCARYNIPVKVFVFNNSCLGMVRQWQELFYDNRYSSTLYPRDPDFVKIAEGMGASGLRVEKPEQVEGAIEKALKIDGPVVVDFKIPQEACVFPMVPSGGCISDMIFSK
ncbi:MAG: biosynthetic-type acetolactate synthase large subunit [Synergistaceae bacterium]|nr:biosynthetic-type acetolactate synthase large subunit [Synergistaceae bacterium]